MNDAEAFIKSKESKISRIRDEIQQAKQDFVQKLEQKDIELDAAKRASSDQIESIQVKYI